MVDIIIVELAPIQAQALVVAETFGALRADKFERTLKYGVLDALGLRRGGALFHLLRRLRFHHLVRSGCVRKLNLLLLQSASLTGVLLGCRRRRDFYNQIL